MTQMEFGVSLYSKRRFSWDPGIILAPLLLLPAAIVALPLGAIASAVEYPLSFSTDDDTLAVRRAASRLLPHTLFAANVPPEFRRREITGDSGMIVYAHDDQHRHDVLPHPEADFRCQVGIESLFHFYDVYYRPLSVHVGLSVSRRFLLDNGNSGGIYFIILRTRDSSFTRRLHLQWS